MELSSVPINEKQFGEGSSVLRGTELYVLTWKERVCKLYDLNTEKETIVFRKDL